MVLDLKNMPFSRRDFIYLYGYLLNRIESLVLLARGIAHTKVWGGGKVPP